MAQFNYAWDNTEVNASSNSTGQIAYYRKKGDIPWISAGFTPANPMAKSVSAALSPAGLLNNNIYQFKVEATCTVNGPTINDNGVQEQIFFACISPTITPDDESVQAVLNVASTDITKARFVLKLSADDSIINTQTVNRVGTTVTATVTGLDSGTEYYFEVELYAVVDGEEVISSSSEHLNNPCGVYEFETDTVDTSCNAPSGFGVTYSGGALHLNWTPNVNANTISQRASKRIKSVGGAYSTVGFSPANDLTTAANTTVPVVNLNTVYEFKVATICTVGGPAETSVVENIQFSCIAPSLSADSESVTVTLNVAGTDLTKALFTLRKIDDDSIAGGPTLAMRSVNTISITFTGLYPNTEYYVQYAMYATVSGGDADSSSASYLNTLCGGAEAGYIIDTDSDSCQEWFNGTAGNLENIDYTDCNGVELTNQTITPGSSICAEPGTVTGGDSGNLTLVTTCTLGETKITNTNFGATITAIATIPGFTLGAPVATGDTRIGSHNDMAAVMLSITLGGSLGVNPGNLSASVDGVLVACTTVNSIGIKVLGPITASQVQDLHIALNTGACPP